MKKWETLKEDFVLKCTAKFHEPLENFVKRRFLSSILFSKKIPGEVRSLYRAFKQECPNGIVDEETFKEVYEKIFPLGDATRYAHLVFNAIDR